MRKENMRPTPLVFPSITPLFPHSYSSECLCLCVYRCARTPSRLLRLDVFTTDPYLLTTKYCYCYTNMHARTITIILACIHVRYGKYT